MRLLYCLYFMIKNILLQKYIWFIFDRVDISTEQYFAKYFVQTKTSGRRMHDCVFNADIYRGNKNKCIKRKHFNAKIIILCDIWIPINYILKCIRLYPVFQFKLNSYLHHSLRVSNAYHVCGVLFNQNWQLKSISGWCCKGRVHLCVWLFS